MTKTIKINFLKDYVNEQLEQNVSEEYRKALCLFLETILHKTKQYRGFQYFDWINGGQYNWEKGDKSLPVKPHLGPEYKRVYY